MLVISNNLSFRNRDFVKAAKEGDSMSMTARAEVLKKVGADMLNVNLSLDGDGDEKYLPVAVKAVSRAGLPVFIDSRNPEAVLASLEAVGGDATVNYLSADPAMSGAMAEILKASAGKGADLVIYPVKGGTPSDAEERLKNISDLMDSANDAGIPNDRLIIDPVIMHLGGGVGQEHSVYVMLTMHGLLELVDPPVRTTCWISNASAGLPADKRGAINSTYLAMLAGVGLWSVFMDVHDRELMRTVRLIRDLKNEAVYSPTDAAL